MIDQLLSQAFRENPIQGAILSVLIDGGRIVSTGEVSENLLNMVPDLFPFEKRDLKNPSEIVAYDARDLLLVENLSVDELWNLNRQTGAQIALLSDQALDPSLSDYQFQEKDLRSALLGVRSLWEQISSQIAQAFPQGPLANKALFLDRDGVVLEDVHYLKDPAQVRLRSDVVDTFSKAREQGLQIFILTNQSGIGRGMLSISDYEAVNAKMLSLLAQEGQYVDRVIHSPFFEGSHLLTGLVRHSLRKPRPGMIHSVMREFRIDLSQSLLVGDSATDLMCGVLAGVSKVFLLKGPRFKDEEIKWRDWPLLSRSGYGVKPPEISSLIEIF